MSFLIPCDDIIDGIGKDNESLRINKTLVIIGYQEIHWMNNTPIKECTFSTFNSLLNSDDNITVDNIVYIKYMDIFLWHKTNKIDRMYASGNTQKSETWDKIKHKYLHHFDHNKEEKKDENPASKSVKKIILNIDKNPTELPGQQQKHRYYNYHWDNKSENIINNGFYEISDKNDSYKTTKINIEKILKKAYKKTKLYHHSTTFKFLTGKQLDDVYRNYENMEINIMNESTLNTIYRLQMEKDKIFKKICILNVYGEQNNFSRNCTLNHSLNKYNYDVCAYKSDEAAQYLYSNTMVYSPNCIFFNDLNGNLIANYFKVSFITAHPVNYKEFIRIKEKMFNESVFDEKLKLLDDKLLNNNNKKYKYKSKKKTKEENKDYIYKMNEVKEKLTEIMSDRIRRMIEIAIYNGCDCVVFNAFGCNQGFGNNIKQIADIFADFIRNVYFNCFKAIIFTILDKSVRNQRRSNRKKNKDLSKFETFEQIFQDRFTAR